MPGRARRQLSRRAGHAAARSTARSTCCAQHVLGMACAAPFDADELYDGGASAPRPMPTLDRETFDRVVDFVATGGYALRTYERYARIRQTKDGLWRIANPRVAQQYRLNVGTIIEMPMLNVRYVRHGQGHGRRAAGRCSARSRNISSRRWRQGDTFLFAGKVLRFEGIRENECFVSNGTRRRRQGPVLCRRQVPALDLSRRAGARHAGRSRRAGRRCPSRSRDWLRLQKEKSVLPRRDELLVETFPRGNRYYMVAYPFEGRLAHQTLGMLLTRRLERAGARPLGFVATDYSLAVWALRRHRRDVPARTSRRSRELFDEDMLGDDLEAWLAESWMLKRTFRNCARHLRPDREAPSRARRRPAGR